MTRRALVVGIDGYPDGAPTGAVQGTCCDDALAVAECLGFNDDRSRAWVVNRKLARDARNPVLLKTDLLDTLADLFVHADGDHALFYFAGHALDTPWGPEFCTQDGTGPGEGVPFSSVAALINASQAESITVILDCCYAGALAGELSRENVALLAASGEDEEALVGASSRFTDLLVEGLQGAASDEQGRVTALSLYSYAWAGLADSTRRPLLAYRGADVTTLRRVRPWASLEAFRALPELFPDEGASLLLTPDDLDADAARVALLTELGAARLVDAGMAHVAEVARSGGEITLTLIGRYYRRLVLNGTI